MRIRLQLLLPLLLAGLLAGGFFLTGALVESAVRTSLTTVAGLTRERAVEDALRAVWLAAILVTLLALVGGALLARFIVRPLDRIRQAAERLDAPGAPLDLPDPGTAVAEIRDVAAGFSRAAIELRERQERALREGSELAALVEAVSEGIIHVNEEGRVARVNRAGSRILRLPDHPEARPVAALLRHPDMRRIAERGLKGEGTAGEEVVLDDRRVMVSVSPQPAGGFVATLVDLTDLRRLEEVRRDFVANASHELKTPLTSIRGYSETLLGADLPEEDRRQFLATIARNAERLQRIVDDLLDLSRLESGRWEPELVPIHALTAAERAWEPFAERARERGVGFSARAPDDDRVLADRGALGHVFANLFDNALRYTPAGGRIDVRVHGCGPPPPTGALAGAASPAGGGSGSSAGESRGPDGRVGPGRGWVAIEVADTGAGIPTEALPRIFERFYRVDPARSRAEGGTGLGLSIVRHMVESMGGQVEAESLLGKGSTIRVRLRAPAP